MTTFGCSESCFNGTIVVTSVYILTPAHGPISCFSKLQISHVKLLESSNNQIPHHNSLPTTHIPAA